MMLTRTEALALITPGVRQVLDKVGGQKSAFVPSVLMDAGVPPAIVKVLVAARGPQEKARTTLVGKKKRVLTSEYVWGPDVMGFLKGIQ